MRFLSSSALASAPKLRLAASCSAAETIELLLPRPARQLPGPQSLGRARVADLQIGAARGLRKSRAAPVPVAAAITRPWRPPAPYACSCPSARLRSLHAPARGS